MLNPGPADVMLAKDSLLGYLMPVKQIVTSAGDRMDDPRAASAQWTGGDGLVYQWTTHLPRGSAAAEAAPHQKGFVERSRLAETSCPLGSGSCRTTKLEGRGDRPHCSTDEEETSKGLEGGGASTTSP